MLFDGNGEIHGKWAAGDIFGETVIVKAGRIKTDWASISLTNNGSAIVCAARKDVPGCMRFSSLEQLKQAINSRKMSVKKWAVAVPRSSCILKQIVLPASDLAEAAKMVEFELPSLVPLPLDEVVYGCTLLNKEDNMLNVLVCILKVSTLNAYLKPYEAIGIKPHRITLETLAIQSWFNRANAGSSGPEISALIGRERCVVLTCVSGNFHRSSELTLSDGDAAISAREVVEEILNQRDALPVSLKKESMVLLGGAEEYVPEIKNLFSFVPRDGSIVPKIAVVANPQISRYENGRYERDGDGFCYEAVVAAGLLELAAASKLPQSNLLPQQYARKYQRKSLLFNYLLTGLLLLLLIVLLWLCLFAAYWRIERISNAIESQIAPIEQIASSVDSKRQRVKAIQNQLSNRGQITQIIEELYKYTPKTITISELKFISTYNKASVDIKGQAQMLANAFEYTDAMREADLLDEMQIINAQQIPRPGGSVVEFKAHCVIRND